MAYFHGIYITEISGIAGSAGVTPITPSPVLPTVTLSADLSLPEGSSGPKLFVYTVTRSANVGAASVAWSFSAGATNASDFTGGTLPAGGAVALADGVASGTFTISVNGDADVEGDEGFSVSIAAPAGYALDARSSATGTIVNDDSAPLPTVTLSADLSLPEGSSGPKLFTYTVSRSASAGAVSIPWSFSAGGTNAADFTSATSPGGGAVALADGVASGTFTISVNGDTSVEADETFTVSIAAPTGYALGARSSATGTILNDDVAAPSIITAYAGALSSADLGAFTGTLGTPRGGDKPVSGDGSTSELLRVSGGRLLVGSAF